MSRRLVGIALGAGLCAAWAEPCAAVQPDESAVESMFRLFTDSGNVTVRSLMNDYVARLGGNAALTLHWNNERVTIVGSSRVDLQACKLEYSIVSPK